jgi:hypothetical protein
MTTSDPAGRLSEVADLRRALETVFRDHNIAGLGTQSRPTLIIAVVAGALGRQPPLAARNKGSRHPRW